MIKPAKCAALIPSEYRKPIPQEPVPTDNTIGSWVTYGLNTSTKLDDANTREGSTIGTVEKCEAAQQ